MGPRTILAAWGVGAVLALCGAHAYGALVGRVPRSGGEYRLLSDLLHPSVGYLAGWASLLVGFAAPVAVDAVAVGAFFDTLVGGLPPTLVGTVVIVALTALHALRIDVSRGGQNLLVAVKLVGVAAFVVLGFALGGGALPTWSPPNVSASPLRTFLESQFWIAFAFSGWNAAIYVAGEFREPKRVVPRAMLIGAVVVSVLYLLVNQVLLVNLEPDQLATVLTTDGDRVTLAHLVAGKLLGPIGGTLTSVFVMLALTSAMSAMMMVGPRVYAEMAKDGFLPRWLAGEPAPTGSVVLQGALAIVLVHTHALLQLVQGISSILMIFTGLCMVAVLRLGFGPTPPSWHARVAASVYGIAVGWILFVGLSSNPLAVLWVAVVGAVGLAGYALSRRRAA